MIQQGDFVKLNYTGKLQNGMPFDSTHPDVAEKIGAKNKGPVTICVGQHMLIPGLDEALIGKSGKFSVTIQSEKAFGRKDPKLLKIIPTKQLLQQQIRPYPGLPLTIDGEYGVVRSVSPGRTVVDFNHPLASQEVTYDVEILGVIENEKEQVQALLEPLGIPHESVHVHEGKAIIKLPQLLPQPMLDALNDRITKLTKVKTVSFEQGTAPTAQA